MYVSSYTYCNIVSLISLTEKKMVLILVIFRLGIAKWIFSENRYKISFGYHWKSLLKKLNLFVEQNKIYFHNKTETNTYFNF